MVGSGSSSSGGEEGFTGRAAVGYDHGYDGEVFYLGLALDELDIADLLISAQTFKPRILAV